MKIAMIVLVFVIAIIGLVVYLKGEGVKDKLSSMNSVLSVNGMYYEGRYPKLTISFRDGIVELFNVYEEDFYCQSYDDRPGPWVVSINGSDVMCEDGAYLPVSSVSYQGRELCGVEDIVLAIQNGWRIGEEKRYHLSEKEAYLRSIGRSEEFSCRSAQ